MSQSQPQTIKISLDDKDIPENEIQLLLDESFWNNNGKSDFWNIKEAVIVKHAPIFYNLFKMELDKPEYEGKVKSLRFTLKEHTFNFNPEYTNFGRIKNSAGGSGGGGGSKGYQQTMPLEELFFGTFETANEKIKQDTKARWYYVAQHVIDVDGEMICYVTLKRNRFIPLAN